MNYYVSSKSEKATHWPLVVIKIYPAVVSLYPISDNINLDNSVLFISLLEKNTFPILYGSPVFSDTSAPLSCLGCSVIDVGILHSTH